MSTGPHDPLDERLEGYLKARSAVSVPDDLLPAAMRRLGSEPNRPLWLRSSRMVGGLAAAAALLVVAVIVGVNLPIAPGPVATPPASLLAPASVAPSPTPVPTASPSTSPSGFPSSVADMPVITVAQAVALLNAGQLNGRAVAVAGYFAEEFLPCPMPMGYVAPLQDWCRAVAFTDDDLGLGMDNPMGWSIPSGVANLSPYLVAETAGGEAITYSGGSQPLVVIGHADDPRQWQCPPASRSQCAGDFVVDRIAWADGAAVPLAPLTTNVPARMSLNDLAQATGGHGLLTADAVKASDAWTIDPRFHAVGDNTVWVVRRLTSTITATPDDGTRRVSVWLVADATGTVLDQTDLALSPGYQPARLSIQATRPQVNDSVYPFYRISSGDTTVLETVVGGSTYGSRSETRYGPDMPAILDPGTYTVEAWLATVDWSAGDPVVGEAFGNCSTSISLNALDDVTMQAAYTRSGSCTWGPAPSASPF